MLRYSFFLIFFITSILYLFRNVKYLYIITCERSLVFVILWGRRLNNSWKMRLFLIHKYIIRTFCCLSYISSTEASTLPPALRAWSSCSAEDHNVNMTPPPCWPSVRLNALFCIYVPGWKPGKPPLSWRQRFSSISRLAVRAPPPHPCDPPASDGQLQTEQRARLKTTTLSTEERHHSASPLFRRIRNEEIEGRSSLRGPTLIPLILPHPLPASGARSAVAKKTQGFLMRNWQRDASRSHPQEMTLSVMI